MKLTINSTIRLDTYKIGCLIAYIYIFVAYVAQDLVISSRFTSLMLYIFLAYSAYVFVSRFRANYSLSVFACWYLLFGLISCITALYAPSFSGATGSLYAMLVAFCLGLFLQMYARNDLEFSRIAWCYAISSFALVVLLFLTGNLKGEAGDRLGNELVGNANTFAAMMMMATMFAIWLLVYKTKTWLSKILMLTIIVADLYALVLSGGRKYFIIPFLFFYLLLLFKTNKRGKRHIIIYTVLFAGMIAVVWYLIMNVESFYNAIGVRMEDFLKSLSGEEGDNSSRVREIMRKVAFEKWLERPLWGYGFDSFKYLAQTTVGEFFYSHCNYTELLYSGGIFYFLLFYWIHYRIVRNAFRNKSIPVAYKAFAIATTVSWLVFDYGGVSYNSNPTLIMLVMAYNASTFANKETKTNGQTANTEAAPKE